MTVPLPSYLRAGKASDLKDPVDRALFRFFEMIPGLLAWGTLAMAIGLSWFWPIGVAVFIIAFDVYWVLKTMYLAVHLIIAYKRMQKNLATDWMAELAALQQSALHTSALVQKCESAEVHGKNIYRHDNTGHMSPVTLPWQELWHLIILPFYNESEEVIRSSIAALAACRYPKERCIVVLAAEERAGAHGERVVAVMQKEFGSTFGVFFSTMHPATIVGEIAGKGSNEAWAARKAQALLDAKGISYDRVILSVFDSDTRAFPDYFARLTHAYCTVQNPLRSSFQPVPVFNNNIWDAPFFSRVVATSSTFWHMMKQENEKRLTTFSSHSMSFKAIVDMDFWQTNIVSEDSRVFWQALLTFSGDYAVVPLHFPVAMDACLAPTFVQTAKNTYKQQRRWGWGVENVPYMLFGFLKNRAIPVGMKMRYIFLQLEGFWSWATNALLLFSLGWMPLALGGEKFNNSVLSYNLPLVTRSLMTIALVGLFVSAAVSMLLLPPRPRRFGKRRTFSMALQWLILPVSIMVLGALPGLEAQTRLMLGRYMGFWVTEKARVSN